MQEIKSETLEALTKSEWLPRFEAHKNRADMLTRDHLQRRARGEKHPIEDFLFTYYNLKPSQLARWHPGHDAAILDAPHTREWKYYKTQGSVSFVDVETFYEKRGSTAHYIKQLFINTLESTPSFGCFGLHEWAMVYKLTPDQLRHRGLRLRIGAEATNVVVETNPIGCSHYDAYRFFTPEAAPLNTLRPTRENQLETEQPGCLHAGMDVYKWVMKLGPLVPGEILLNSFELARDIRQVDMQASPYDVSDFGLEAVKIETPEGKKEYAGLQRGFAERGNVLRRQVIEILDRAEAKLPAHFS